MKHLIKKQNRVLLRELVVTDFKMRYQSSVIGYAWSILKPLFMFIILYLVFAEFLKVGDSVPHYSIYLLIGIMLWNYFNEMTLQSTTAIVGHGDLIRKISIPRWLIIAATSISASINLLINAVVLLVFIFIAGVDTNIFVLSVPLLLLELYIFALGISLFLSAAYVKFRDVSYIWEVVLQAGFYATPILYPLSVIPNVTVHKILLLNPVAQIIQDLRYAIVTDKSITIHQVFDGGYYMLIPYIIVLLVAVLGVWYFRKESKYFAENI